MRSVDTVIVGAGQAGLLVSAGLSRLGRDHVVLDRRAALGGGWQDRWDDFVLVGPNWTTSFEGFPYRGQDPDGYMARDELIAHMRAYAGAIAAPVQLDTDVTRLERLDDPRARFRLTTSQGLVEARNVVVAGGPFQRPHIPALASGFAPSILQLHSHDYRNPGQLPPGGVLLVGSGQTGIQLAEELLAAGRPVAMAVGRCGRSRRRYRGRDVFWWLREIALRGPSVGVSLPTAADLPDARARFACNPQLSGHGVNHEVNLRALARDGLRLAGRLEGADGTQARFADDLGPALQFADANFDVRLRPMFDAFADRTGEGLPDEPPEPMTFEPPGMTQLDLAAEGFSTVLWTSGYRPAFHWIEAPILDEMGLPRQRDWRTEVPGLTFIGTPWLVDMGSANLVAIERDAIALVNSIGASPDVHGGDG
jgi:putative flavoprotein involved in K+ transport